MNSFLSSYMNTARHLIQNRRHLWIAVIVSVLMWIAIFSAVL